MKKSQAIYGIRAVIEAINSGKEIDKVFLKKGLKGELISELMVLLRTENIPFQTVPLEKLNRITQKNHQGVIAFISMVSYIDIEKLVPILYEQGKNPFLLILDEISDVRNFGAIARTAEVAGVDAIIIPAKGSAQINADAIKTSAGALHTIPVCRSFNMKETATFLKQSGIKLIAATEKAANYYYDSDYSVPVAIIMGSEDTGVNTNLLKIADEIVKIPVIGKIDSLNVSVAAGILSFEAVKQRMK